jgi:hypothetical protein
MFVTPDDGMIFRNIYCVSPFFWVIFNLANPRFLFLICFALIVECPLATVDLSKIYGRSHPVTIFFTLILEGLSTTAGSAGRHGGRREW